MATKLAMPAPLAKSAILSGVNRPGLGEGQLRADSPLPAQFLPSGLLAALAPQITRGARHSYFCAFSQGQSVVDVHSKVADRVLYLAVPQQYLHSPQVTSRFVN